MDSHMLSSDLYRNTVAHNTMHPPNEINGGGGGREGGGRDSFENKKILF